MLSEFSKKLGILIGSTLISLLLVIGLAEGYGHYRYSQWKAQYALEGDWYNRLTQPSPNVQLMWEYRPYGQYGSIKTNRFGFREKDAISTAGLPGLERVAFIGDSITLGLGVEPEEMFSAQFQVMAYANHQKELQSLNFSVDGYNALQIQEMLTSKTLAFNPDLIVYAMCLNDFDFKDSSGEKVRYFQKPRSFIFERLERELLWRFYVDDFHRYHYGKNNAAVMNAISKMQRAAQSIKARFLVVLVPVFNFNAEGVGYPYAKLHKAIGENLRLTNTPFLDLFEYFSDTKNHSSRFSLDIWHPNATGHALIAEVIAKQLYGSQ